MKVWKSGMGASYANARGKNALLPGESLKERREVAAKRTAKANAKAQSRERRRARWSAALLYADAKMAETN